jgi:hypothetical protein
MRYARALGRWWPRRPIPYLAALVVGLVALQLTFFLFPNDILEMTPAKAVDTVGWGALIWASAPYALFCLSVAALVGYLFSRRAHKFEAHEVLMLIEGEIFAWDGKNVRQVGGSGLGHSLCIHNGDVIEGGPGAVLNYGSGKMYENDKGDPVDAVCSHMGTLYDAYFRFVGARLTEGSIVRETLSNTVVARRQRRIRSLCSHSGVLYDGSDVSSIYETMTDKLIIEHCDADVLCSHDGHLYAGGENGLIYNVLARQPVARRASPISGLCSVEGRLYDASRDGVRDTFSGWKVVDYAQIRVRTKTYPRGRNIDDSVIYSMLPGEKEFVHKFVTFIKGDPRWWDEAFNK